MEDHDIGGWRATFPLALVLLSLASLALVDILVHRRIGTVLTVLLVLLATLGALMVVRLGREYRALAQRLAVRANEQAALREVSRVLSASVSVREAVEAIAERAVATTHASGAYVERADTPVPGTEVEVVAVAGAGVPPLGTRIPYPGSLSEEIIESGDASVMTEIGAIGERMAPYLQKSCRGCSGLVVPLNSEGGVLGALVLLRGAEEAHFTREEAAHARVLGDLASASLRRVLLLEREREARAEVTTLLESITDAFFALDREWRFTYVNQEAERVLMRSREELMGRSLWEEFPDSVNGTFDHEYHRAVAEQTAVEFEEFYPPFQRWFNVRAYPTEEGLSVFFRDVTSRKRAEAKLRESERNFRTLGNSIPQLAWMASPDGEILWFNDRWYEYTGTTPEEMRSWGWTKLHHPDHAARVTEGILRAFETDQPWEDTFPIRSRTGEYRWFLSRALPVRDAEGRVLRWFGTNTDVTEHREAEAERERLLEREREARAEAERRREELESVTESRTRLMRGFSHDVKNPLGAADSYAQLLEEGILGELSRKQRESVERIRRSIHASLRLIHDLLELARVEAGQLEVECVPTDVAQAAKEVAEDFRAQAEAAGLDLEVRVPEPLRAETDPIRIRQVLGNLLSNAVKYTSEGRVAITAEIRGNGEASRPGAWVAVRVTDTGPGIPEEKREQIFQEFTRLDPDAPHGAGVGLAISRRIARILGGDITVESEEGRGSGFTLWLPGPGP